MLSNIEAHNLNNFVTNILKKDPKLPESRWNIDAFFKHKLDEIQGLGEATDFQLELYEDFSLKYLQEPYLLNIRQKH